MSVAAYTKTPTEKKRYEIDYTDWLDDDETLSGVPSFTINDGNPGSLVISLPVIDATGKLLWFFISGGDDGETYQLVVEVTTSAGQIKDDCLVISVASC